MFVLVSSNQDNNSKSIKPKGIINQKILWRNKKVMTRQNVDYTTGCSLDYDYIKSHYRLIAVDLSRQKKLNADRKAIQQIHFFGQLKKTDAVNADGIWSILLIILEKNHRNDTKILSRKYYKRWENLKKQE